MKSKGALTVKTMKTILFVGLLLAGIQGAWGAGAGSFYSQVEGIADDVAFRRVLNRLLVETHTKRLSYGELWDALAKTDADPHQAGNVILLYTGRSQDKSKRTGRGGQGGNTWNREHTWPKSHGFPDKSAYAHTDLHHLRPADKSVNGDRGNLDFGDGGNDHNECSCRFRKGNDGNWEAPDEMKGDVARMMFYMAVRYDGDSRSKTPDLVLKQGKTAMREPALGDLATLLKWHADDPSSAWERGRNDRIQKEQGNRNPFIDHPEWVSRIWKYESLE